MAQRNTAAEGQRLRGGERGGQVEDRAGRDPGGVEDRQPLAAGLRRELLREDRDQLVAVLDAVAVRGESRVGGEVRLAQRRPETRPLPLAPDPKRDLAIRRREGLVRDDARVRVAAADRRPPGHQRVLGLVDQDRKRALQQ